GLSGFDVIRLIMGALSEAGGLSPEVAEVLAEYDYRLIEGANEDIQLSALLAQLVKLMRREG
ncbi:MAG: Replication factor C small subunit, partial [Candidatus Geothermarchaeales archaeon]